MFQSVCRKSGLFPASLERKKVFSHFTTSHVDFYLILLKTTFLSLSGQVTLFSTLFLRRRFSFLSYQNCVFDLLSYRNHLLVWFQLNWKLRALCHKKQRFSFSRQNTLLKVSQDGKYILVCLASNWALSSVIAPVKRFFFTFLASDPDFYLIALKTTFQPVFG